MQPLHQIIQKTLQDQGYTIISFTNPPNTQITSLQLQIPHDKEGWNINIGHIWLHEYPKPLQLYITTDTNGYKTAGLELNQSDPELLKKLNDFYKPPIA